MRRPLFVLPLALVAACGGSAVDFTGNYTIGITDGANTCFSTGWTTGSMTSGIPFTITQNGNDVSGQVGGALKVLAIANAGTSQFNGTANGSSFTLTLPGTTQYTQGGCRYYIGTTIDASLSGDELTGTVVYTASTNGSSDCSTLTNCQSTQNFNGTRPPTS